MASVMGICGGLVGPKSGNVEKVSVLTVVEWIEFKPSRGMRSTELNRSSRSSNDLKARNVADPNSSGRTKSVCAALRTKGWQATGIGVGQTVW